MLFGPLSLTGELEPSGAVSTHKEGVPEEQLGRWLLALIAHDMYPKKHAAPTQACTYVCTRIHNQR